MGKHTISEMLYSFQNKTQRVKPKNPVILSLIIPAHGLAYKD
jgi:hypothetical protein